MDAFTFVFSLFGLVLGLSLTEVLSGFSRALRMRHTVRLGWLTPLLAVFVMMDIGSFWTGAWVLREHISASYGFVLVGLVVTGVYYLAASIVFPAHGENRQDFDEHYFAHRRQIFGAIAFCNVIGFAATDAMFHVAWSPNYILATAIYYPALAIGFVTSRPRVSAGVLLVLIAFCVWSGALTFFPSLTPFR